jgi:hypothetical protein
MAALRTFKADLGNFSEQFSRSDLSQDKQVSFIFTAATDSKRGHYNLMLGPQDKAVLF